jgi:acyl-CoA thioester hydrolase
MGQPAVYEHPFRVASVDIDLLGHVNNVVYLRYTQDAAFAHWYAAAGNEYVESLVWVVRRHEIDYLQPAFAGDELLTRTWVGAASGASFERFAEITRPKDGQVLARVKSVWVALDAKTLRPRRVTAELRSRFEVKPIGDDPDDREMTADADRGTD